jgi:hypothetical protein
MTLFKGLIGSSNTLFCCPRLARLCKSLDFTRTAAAGFARAALTEPATSSRTAVVTIS